MGDSVRFSVCVLRRRSFEKRGLVIVKVTFRVLCMNFILYLCTRIAIISYFLIEHLKRLSVMDGRFFRVSGMTLT